MVALDEAPPTYLVSPYKTTSVDWIALKEASSADLDIPEETRTADLLGQEAHYRAQAFSYSLSKSIQQPSTATSPSSIALMSRPGTSHDFGAKRGLPYAGLCSICQSNKARGRILRQSSSEKTGKSISFSKNGLPPLRPPYVSELQTHPSPANACRSLAWGPFEEQVH